MLIKGKARGGAASLSQHLENTEENERVALMETRGVVANDLDGALREIAAVGSGAASKRPFYHASISPDPDEPALTDAQKAVAIDRLEKALGLTDQPRAVIEHGKKGREHMHVVWSRIDTENMRAISDSHNYRTHEEVSRELEREFGHKRIQGAHVEREGVERPNRTPSHNEMQQAKRTGLSPQEAKELITPLWQTTDSGKAFMAAVEEKGWAVARGDKRDFVLIDPHGEAHSLARRVEGAKVKDVRERMADIDPASLPSVEHARAAMLERQAARDLVQGSPAVPEIPAPAPEPSAPVVTSTVVAREVRTEQTHTETRVPHQGAHTSETFSLVGTMLGHVIGNVVMDFVSDQVVEQVGQEFGHEAGEIAEQVAEAVHTISEIKETVEIVHEIAAPKSRHHDNNGVRVNVGGEAVRLVEYVATQATSEPPRKISAEEYVDNPAVRRDYMRQQLAEAERTAALAQMREDIAAGKGIEPAAVSKLNADDISNIRAKGDAHLIELIEQQGKQRQRKREEGGRERD